ncbi:response regulator transcription factor [Hydrotalea sp.]|uniref:response regulator transcription factor n=1 Tax=Hydrotalea sp. TaxID=2881279 RepID=UPI002604F873|nr:response regulator transcription factor [Hydrotalea sp.]
MNKEVKLALVEDKPAALLHLSRLVAEIPNMQIVFTAHHGADFLQQLQQTKTEPDVVITDLLMPEIDGMSLAGILHYARPQMLVIVLSVFLSEIEIAELMDIGVKGFLAKANLTSAMIAKAMETVRKGQVFMDETLFDKEKAFAELRRIQQLPTDKKGTKKLTHKELQFLQLLVALEDYKQIAESMNLSVKSVHYYAHRLREKNRNANKNSTNIICC